MPIEAVQKAIANPLCFGGVELVGDLLKVMRRVGAAR
jgi:hypothetical protein